MADGPLVTIVIPVWRDEYALPDLLDRLSPSPDLEIVVARALGDESRSDCLRAAYPHVRWTSAPRGRAVQMNAGAAMASGRWLLFLHADSRLPEGWRTALAQADADPGIAFGAFRLALDSGAWQARAIELGVRVRVALLGLPYGDQALFVRRATFEAMDGYRDLPLMEDIDLVRRCRRFGRLLRVRAPVLTSARRWQRDGWFRRSAGNVVLAGRFFLGASPARLARRYTGRKRRAIVMMARAPWMAGKTRLSVGDAGAHGELREALFLDTLDAVAAVDGAEHIVACEPAAAAEEMRALAGPEVDVVAQRGSSLGERMLRLFEDVFRFGVESAVIVGSDLPDLPAQHLRDALAALEADAGAIVIGPAADGGYYLIGMRRLHPAVFDRIEWSTHRVLEDTLAAAKAHGIPVVLVGKWADVDDLADLDRLMKSTTGDRARRTRAWGVRHLTSR